MKAIDYLSSLIAGQKMGSSIPVQVCELEMLKTYLEIQQTMAEGRAALAKAEPAGWQKIETAPEGTMILCANMKAMEARSWAYVAWIAGGKVCGYRMDMPTHWMPLPTPPKEQQ